MTPMFIQMACCFCSKPLERKFNHSGDIVFDLYLCRGCLSPNYDTLHRQLYFKGKTTLLCDQIRIDDYLVVRYHQPANKNDEYKYSIIYKEILGVLDSSPDMEPISLNKPVCKIDHVIDLPVHNLELLKRKLQIWTTFS